MANADNRRRKKWENFRHFFYSVSELLRRFHFNFFFPLSNRDWSRCEVPKCELENNFFFSFRLHIRFRWCLEILISFSLGFFGVRSIISASRWFEIYANGRLRKKCVVFHCVDKKLSSSYWNSATIGLTAMRNHVWRHNNFQVSHSLRFSHTSWGCSIMILCITLFFWVFYSVVRPRASNNYSIFFPSKYLYIFLLCTFSLLCTRTIRRLPEFKLDWKSEHIIFFFSPKHNCITESTPTKKWGSVWVVQELRCI